MNQPLPADPAPASFRLDPRLAGDGPALGDLPLCHVRLVDDARFFWIVLVPRRPALVELSDLPAPERGALMEEIATASTALKAVSGCTKLNVAALGNMVPQLHVHIIGRVAGDAAWPGPVFGVGVRDPLGPALAARADLLRAALGLIAPV
ncbi:MAG: HIT family protein [Rhizobiales bacterium 32-66-8]|nr:MAG: HIT family protein [Rhizobiales bacterium 32-66-8]